jgi:hypothetical protein
MLQSERPRHLEQASHEQRNPARHGTELSRKWAAIHPPLEEELNVFSLQCSRDTHVTSRRAGFDDRQSVVAILQCIGDIVIECLIRAVDDGLAA